MRKYDEVQALLKRLRDNKVTLGHGEYGVDSLCEQAANEIEELTDLLEKQQKIIRRMYVEHFPNTWFVCGEGGDKNQNNLPRYIEVCPAYGLDWSVVYERTDKIIGGMGS